MKLGYCKDCKYGFEIELFDKIYCCKFLKSKLSNKKGMIEKDKARKYKCYKPKKGAKKR